MQNRSLARDDSGFCEFYTGHRCSDVQFASTVTYVVYLHFDCCLLILWPTKWVCGVSQNMTSMILVVCGCVVWSMNHVFSQNYLLYFVTCSCSRCISMFNHHVEWTCQTHVHNLYVYHCLSNYVETDIQVMCIIFAISSFLSGLCFFLGQT